MQLLAQRRPATQQQLAQLIGRQKAEVYGQQLLAALLKHTVGEAGEEPGGVPGQQQQQQQQQQGKQAKQAKHQPKARAHPAMAKPQRQAAGARSPRRQRQQLGAAGPGPTKAGPDVVVLDSSGEEDSDFEAPAAKRGKKA